MDHWNYSDFVCDELLAAYMCARTSQLYWTTITFDGALQNVVSMSDIPIRNYIGTL